MTQPAPSLGPPDQLLGKSIKGKYRLERLLGAGGMGAVYEASDPGGQRYAVKIIHPHIAEAATNRFEREIQVGSEVQSPHVVPVLDSGREPTGELFLVMPLLQGYDLAGLLERMGPIHPSIAVRLILQACEGLTAAHRVGVVHRDIKPSNLFLNHCADGEVRVMICDFGVAKRAEMYDDSHLTRTGASMGSPLYMSPEQVLSAKHADDRTDIYGIGATLYELLSGITPHGDAANLSDLLVRICTKNPPSIQERAPWVGPELAVAVHKALSRAPEQRFESMKDLGAALWPSAGGEIRVHASQLVPVTPDLRVYVAPRADLSHVTSPESQAVPVPGLGAVTNDPMIGKRLSGKYRILRLLGRGGMGDVYEAEAPDGTRVAAKVIAGDLRAEGSEAHRRFVREARAAMSIDSPHVVKTLDAGTDEAQQAPYIIMELMRGVDLSALIKRQGAMEPTVVVRAIIQAARGVSAAHTEGIIHRDIKPANMFLSVRPGDPNVTVKVCDFGVAKRVNVDGTTGEATSGELTKTGGMLGSPAYMSPEQAQSARTVDGRSDVWSLGISLYEGLSGHQPWSSCTSLGQIIVAICTAPVPWLQDVSPWVDPGLAEVVHRALQRDPAQRWQFVEDLIAALLPYAGRDEVISREELRGLDATRRQQVASRSERQAELAASIPTAMSTTTTGQAAPRAGTVIAIAAAAVLVVGGIGAGGLYEVTRAEPAPAAASVPGELLIEGAVVIIEPPDAKVTVNGKPTQLVQGRLKFDGRPGDSFTVAISRGDDQRSATVVITRDGKASPDRLALEPKKVGDLGKAIENPIVSPEKRPAAVAPARPGPKPAEPAPPAAPPAGAPAPKPKPAPTAVGPVEDW
jgi:eukaryotic-like serine/threonine-protein kinase